MKQALTWSDIKSICGAHGLFRDADHWLVPLLDVSDDWPSVAELNNATRQIRPDFSWEFVTQARVPRRAKSRGMASLSGYVAMIGSEGKIPVRERHAHDFLNCLSFLMFPASKAALNQRHHLESPDGLQPGQNRTRTQDLLTMFDEGGVLRLIGSDHVHKDLIFGHAIFEHALAGKTLRAARLDFHMNDQLIDKTIESATDIADQLFAHWLTDPDNCLSSQEFSHVWIEN